MRATRSIVSILFAIAMVACPASSFAQVSAALTITLAPPLIPVYEQPPIPTDGDIWAPGYWAWGPSGYYWVPGGWVMPPAPGLLWTPGYWGWDGGAGGAYVWHAGYWGPHIGFYGGINYGFGYTGVGYQGGVWDHGRFHYNAAVNNFGSARIANTYTKTVVNNATVTHVSYNGGNGGTRAQPTAEERAAAGEHHVQPTALQVRQERAARANRQSLASVNGGRPPAAATRQPGAATAPATVGSRSAAQPGRAPAPHVAGPASRPPAPHVVGSASRPPGAAPERHVAANHPPSHAAPVSKPQAGKPAATAEKPANKPQEK
jgi:hypothetical protein